jgi:GDP-L-fucose synthase
MRKIFIAGHKGIAGSAIVRQLEQQIKDGAELEFVMRDRSQLNLVSQTDVQVFFANEYIDEVYLAAAKLGIIIANNTYPSDFIYEYLIIQSNIIHSAHLADVNYILFLGSSCIYPKLAAQPMAKSSLLTGTLAY